ARAMYTTGHLIVHFELAAAGLAELCNLVEFFGKCRFHATWTWTEEGMECCHGGEPFIRLKETLPPDGNAIVLLGDAVLLFGTQPGKSGFDKIESVLAPERLTIYYVPCMGRSA